MHHGYLEFFHLSFFLNHTQYCVLSMYTVINVNKVDDTKVSCLKSVKDKFWLDAPWVSRVFSSFVFLNHTQCTCIINVHCHQCQ